jgi:hypothetical protein
MRQIGVLALALGASLLLAYRVWTDDSPERAADAVEVYRAAADDVTGLTWAAERLTVAVERRSDGAGAYTWVTVTETPEATEGTPAGVPETTSFKGNDKADELWASFGPLLALRELTGATGGAALGLDEPAATVTVRRAAGDVSLTVGGETFGSKDRYVGHDGRVFLVDDQTLKPLEFAKTRLVDRAILPFEPNDVVRVEIDADGASAAWTHENRDDARNDAWKRDGATEERDEVGKTLLGKVLRVRAQQYVAEPPADLVPVATVRVHGESGVAVVEVLKAPDDTWYARTSHNRGVVSLVPSLASDAFGDLSSVL